MYHLDLKTGYLYFRSQKLLVFPSRPHSPTHPPLPGSSCQTNTVDCLCVWTSYVESEGMCFLCLLPSWIIMFMRFNHIFKCSWQVFLTLVRSTFIVWKCSNLFIDPDVNGHLGSFQGRAVMNSFPINIPGHDSGTWLNAEYLLTFQYSLSGSLYGISEMLELWPLGQSRGLPDNPVWGRGCPGLQACFPPAVLLFFWAPQFPCPPDSLCTALSSAIWLIGPLSRTACGLWWYSLGPPPLLSPPLLVSPAHIHHLWLKYPHAILSGPPASS